MKKLISAAMAVLLLAGCANNAAVTSETTAAQTTAAAEAATTTAAAAATAETTTETTAAELAAETAPVPEMSDECKALYGAFLTDIIENDGRYNKLKTMFDIYDLDSDGTPELFVSYKYEQEPAADIYTVSDGVLRQIGSDIGTYWGMIANRDFFVNNDTVEEWELFVLKYPLDNETVKEVFGYVPAPEMSVECRALYGKLLVSIIENTEEFNGTPMFDLYDMDGDGIPELFVSAGDFHYCGVDIYTVSGGEVIKLVKGSGSWGETLVSGKYLRGGFSNMGASIDKIYEKNGLQMVQLVTLESAEMWNTVGEDEEVPVEYRINDKTVSEKEYDAEWEKYPDEWESVGRRYLLYMKIINELFHPVPEMTDECKALYGEFLVGFLGSDEKYSFDFYDLDSDGVPELFMTYTYPGTGVFLYTICDGGVIQLECDPYPFGEANVSGDCLFVKVITNGFGEELYYRKSGNTLVLLDMLECWYYPDDGTRSFLINGEAVSEEEYRTVRDKHGSDWAEIGSRYKVDKKTLEEIFGAVPAPEMSDEYKALYAAVLADIAGSEDYIPSMAMFDLYDMDSDGVPELFVSLNPAHGFGVDIYTVSNGEAVRIGEKLGAWGVAKVCGDSLLSEYTGGGGTTSEFYEKNGNRLDKLVTLDTMVSLDENKELTDEYRINGEQVTEEEYNAEQSKYPDEWKDVGRRYWLDKETAERFFGQ